MSLRFLLDTNVLSEQTRQFRIQMWLKSESDIKNKLRRQQLYFTNFYWGVSDFLNQGNVEF